MNLRVATPTRLRGAAVFAASAVILTVPTAASAAVEHVIAPGESLSSVAAADGLSVEQLAAANGLSAEAGLLAGSALTIPEQSGSTVGLGEAAASGAEPALSGEAGAAGGEDGDGDADDGVGVEAGSAVPVSATGSTGGSYVVQPGDTLSAIAARSGMSVEQLAAVNGLEANAPLISGAVLNVSGAASEAAPSAAPASTMSATGQPVGVAAEGSASAPPYPTEQFVSPSEVGTIAAENEVPPSLAQAVADQESGFNNGLTSPADARGVMQILPGTWSWINENLASSELDPASAESNVRGGVLLLHSLLNATEGNSELAAAGYYQGLPSVLEHGQYPETQQYVGNVQALAQQFGGE